MSRESVCMRLEKLATKATSASEVKSQVKNFLETVEGNSLRTWLMYFDTNHDQKISFGEFHVGMLRLNFTGDTKAIFSHLDHDGSGEITLEEIDSASAVLWVKFRKWCVENFHNARDFLQKLSGGKGKVVDKEVFCQGIKARGWELGMEEILYKSIDIDNSGNVSLTNLSFMENDKKRQRRKLAAKAKAQRLGARKLGERRAAEAALQDFRRHLLSKFGHYVRAWRRSIDTDASMLVQRHEAFRACQDIGWHGNVKLLWKALDRDEDGVTQLEELDGRSAEQLAVFRAFAISKFGGIKAAFKALDRNHQQRLKKGEFFGALAEAGYVGSRKGLFEALDGEGKNYIVAEDLIFLENWRPAAHLTAAENPAAAADFKKALLKHFQHFLKGWRTLDKDGSNRTSWLEFERCGKLVGFKGDGAGAWRALDADLSGYITLEELDKPTYDAIMNFKLWADEEFGGVRVAFSVFDSDQSGDLNYAEFRRCCRSYGFNGDVRSLFIALDYHNAGSLTLKDLAFIANWELPDKTDPAADAAAEGGRPGRFEVATGTVTFATEAPAPGAYEIPSSIGAGRTTPTMHYHGSPRWPAQELSPDPKARDKRTRLPPLQEGVSPQHYNVMSGLQQASWVRAKPQYSFGRSSRPSNERTPRGLPNPGPGDYAPTPPAPSAPKHAFGCRRPVVIHPLARGEG